MDFIWNYIEDDIPEDNETVLLLCTEDLEYYGVGGPLIIGQYRSKTNDFYMEYNDDRGYEIVHEPYNIKMWARIPLPSTDTPPLLRHGQTISDDSGLGLYKAVVWLSTWSPYTGEVDNVDYTHQINSIQVRKYPTRKTILEEKGVKLSTSLIAFISKVDTLITNHNNYVQEHPEVVPEILAQIDRARKCHAKLTSNNEENTTCV